MSESIPPPAYDDINYRWSLYSYFVERIWIGLHKVSRVHLTNCKDHFAAFLPMQVMCSLFFNPASLAKNNCIWFSNWWTVNFLFSVKATLSSASTGWRVRCIRARIQTVMETRNNLLWYLVEHMVSLLEDQVYYELCIFSQYQLLCHTALSCLFWVNLAW